MLEDVFEKIASTSNPAAQELLEILKQRRCEYEKYPETIVLTKVFKEFLHKRLKDYKDSNPTVLTSEDIRLIINIIYNDNTERNLNNRFETVPTLKEYYLSIYSEEKYQQFYQNSIQKMIKKYTGKDYDIENCPENIKKIVQQKYEQILNQPQSDPHTYILRPKTSNKNGGYETYWERFHYGENRETTWRVALNVMPEKDLLEKVDTLAQKYSCSWKYVNTLDGYNRRTDPIIIYFPKESDKKRDEILEELSEITKPYIRKDNYNIYGYQNYGNGIFHAEHTTLARLSNALYNCFYEKELEQIKNLTFFDEIKEFNQQSQNPDPIRQYVINTIATDPKNISGGKLSLLEWLTELNNVAHTPVLFNNKDGSTVQKFYDITFKRNKENNMIWHRTYTGGLLQNIIERECTKPDSPFITTSNYPFIKRIYENNELISENTCEPTKQITPSLIKSR